MKPFSADTLTRRRILQGAAAMAATTAASSWLPVHASSANPQPLPPAGVTPLQVSMVVTAAPNGRLPRGFIGLSPGKSDMGHGGGNSAPDPPYAAGNTAMVRLLRLLAPNGGTLRIGQGSEDTVVWNPNGRGGDSKQVDPIDIKIMVDFLKATGWSVLYGVNLGGMAAKGNNPPLVGTKTPTTPAEAAAEIDCLIRTMKDAFGRKIVNGKENWLNYLTSIEIGNEPNLAGWHANHSFCIAAPKANDAAEQKKLDQQGCGSTIGQWTESGQPAPWGFEETWELIRSAILSVGKKHGVTLPISGPGSTDVTTQATATKPAINNPTSWAVDFGKHKGAELSMLTFHHYEDVKTLEGLLTAKIELQGPNPKPSHTHPTEGILSMLYDASAQTTPVPHMYGISECNSIGSGGRPGISNTYGSALWVIDFLLACARGYSNGLPTGGHGSQFVCINIGDHYSVESGPHGGGNYYSPIYYRGGTVLGVMPIFYGMLFVGKHLGPGELYTTSPLTTDEKPLDLNVSAYALHQPDTGSLKLLVVNKDFTTNAHLEMNVTLPAKYKNAELILLTQGPGGETLPDITAFPATAGAPAGVTIQGETVRSDGSYTPGRPYTLATSGNTVTFHVPALSAVLVQLT